jgi:hypothetical protein
MLCPVFPDMVAAGRVPEILELLRPDLAKEVWAEPYNNRVNWQVVRDAYPAGSAGADWFTAVYERHETSRWSAYAIDLYRQLREHAEQRGWLEKLNYLLYEDLVNAEDARLLGDLAGVLLQTKPRPDGKSQNPHVALLQR